MLQYLNDLSEIKLILRYESYIATFLICMDAMFFNLRFLLIDATDRTL